MIKGAIFDLDGVLVSTDELHFAAWKELADREGIYFDRAINERLRGVSRAESLKIVLEKSDKVYTESELSEMAEYKNGIYRKLLASLSESDVLPGVKNYLTYLKSKGVKTAVASSSKNAVLILEKTGLLGEFAAVADGTEIKNSKPDPEVFLLAAKKLNLAPEECVVFEDAAAGVVAANSGGFTSCGLGAAAFGADMHFASLADEKVYGII